MNKISDNQLLVSITEARARLGGLSATTVYELAKQGHLTKVKIGRRGFITAESLIDLYGSWICCE